MKEISAAAGNQKPWRWGNIYHVTAESNSVSVELRRKSQKIVQ